MHRRPSFQPLTVSSNHQTMFGCGACSALFLQVYKL
jgi:hypothetical protein